VPPPPDAAAPEAVLARVAPGWAAELAYRLVADLTTWRLTSPDGLVRFAKVATGDRARSPTLRGESERMIWAAPYLPVPEGRGAPRAR
jgi:aminoglycoside phosphotransferase